MSTVISPPDVGTTFTLLTIRGTFNAKTIEEARRAHNQAAGSDEGVAAARALGDLSHAVYVRADEQSKDGALEGLFIDIWNSGTGLSQFFANPQVQQGASYIWATRDPMLWVSAPGFPEFQLPPPRGKSERHVGLIRGTVKSMDDAKRTIEASVLKGMNTARLLGQLSREYFVPADPSKRDSQEILGMDVWTDLKGMNEFYSANEDPAVFQIYRGKPATSVWSRPEGQWVEW
jgi:hypothetical protein